MWRNWYIGTWMSTEEKLPLRRSRSMTHLHSLQHPQPRLTSGFAIRGWYPCLMFLQFKAIQFITPWSISRSWLPSMRYPRKDEGSRYYSLRHSKNLPSDCMTWNAYGIKVYPDIVSWETTNICEVTFWLAKFMKYCFILVLFPKKVSWKVLYYPHTCHHWPECQSSDVGYQGSLSIKGAVTLSKFFVDIQSNHDFRCRGPYFFRSYGRIHWRMTVLLTISSSNNKIQEQRKKLLPVVPTFTQL